MSKRGSKSRPIGSLWAWLDAAERFGTKAEHRAFVPSHAERSAARDFVMCIEGSEDFFCAEADPHGAVDYEPAEFLGEV